MANVRLPGMGVEVTRAELSPFGKLVLHALAMLPSPLREKVFFGGSRGTLTRQKAVQSCLGGPKPVEFRFQQGPLRGFAFECLSSHKYFLLGAKYEDHLQKKFAEVVGPNDIAFDIGAHFGWWTLWFSALCKHVVAFEPSPANFSMLQKNVASNRRLNVSLNNLAASDFAGMVPFVDDGSSSHIQNGGSASAANLKVRTIRIDDYAEGPPPTFVKIDVEGSAASVLRGMARTLEEQKPTVVCELHDASEESAVSALLFARSYHSVNLEKMDRFPKHVLARP